MFEDWKQAWRQAVENFQREAAGTDAPPRVRAMERELTTAAGALAKLDQEIRRTRVELGKEREAEQVCRRRESLARDVGDDETVRLAVEFAVRHAERAAVLERKASVLDDERALLAREMDAMRQTLAAAAPSSSTLNAGTADGATAAEPEPRDDREFSRMEREARERVANERLEELKRRMNRG